MDDNSTYCDFAIYAYIKLGHTAKTDTYMLIISQYNWGQKAEKPKVQLYQMKKPFQVHVLNHGPRTRVF